MCGPLEKRSTPEGTLVTTTKEKKRREKKESEQRRIIETSLDLFSFFDLKRKRKRSKKSRERFFFVHPRSVVLFWSFVVLLTG